MTFRPFREEVARSPFATTGLACFLAFAVVGLFLTLIPAYVVSLSYSANLLLAGSAVALVLACSMLAQLAGYRRLAISKVTAFRCSRPDCCCWPSPGRFRPCAHRGNHSGNRAGPGVPRRARQPGLS